ncbi:GNAT family N-acetyltransferase [Streptomyces sp. NPDC091272]|uniref:GNAT family N-acetyltransferase n=1 Tax=Streptomyces sp. NPDC091272 TaxID=3365981 RepID=UPI0038166F94
MPPTDASTETGAGPAPRTAPGNEDTLDLRLPDEFLALCAAEEAAHAPPAGPKGDGRTGVGRVTAGRSVDERADAEGAGDARTSGQRPSATGQDLLDSLVRWGPARTPAGEFRLLPVHPGRDLALLTRWMNDPVVAEFWELAGGEDVTAAHLRAQLDGDGRSVPCLGLLDGTPMSYWEIYRADLDPLARHYPARPHDTGIHLLIGGVADRGCGLGTTLLRAVSELVLDHRPACSRVVAEPDLRNTPSVSAFLGAGFRLSAEIDLPEKRAALMMRDRAHRHQL